MTRGDAMTSATTVERITVGTDDAVGFEVTVDRPVVGRVLEAERRAMWVQDQFTLTAELTDLPEGDADIVTCHRVLSALGAEWAREGYEQAVLRRLPDPAGDRELMWWTRNREPVTDHVVLLGACTQRPTLATLRVTWTATTGDIVAQWPEIRRLVEQWKVTVR